MENFFYEDKFYSDIEELMIDLEIDEESIESMPDFYKCKKGQLEPLVVIDAEWILERIDEERFSENNNERYDLVEYKTNK